MLKISFKPFNESSAGQAPAKW